MRYASAALAVLAVAVLPAAATAAPLPTAPLMHAEDQGVVDIIVARRAHLTSGQRAGLRRRHDVTRVRTMALPDTEVVRAPVGELAATVAALDADPQVRYAEPDYPVRAATADPYFSHLWGLSNTGQAVAGTAGTPGDDIHAVAAWQQSTGAGQTVAVVDTGASFGAPDLQGAYATNPGETGNGKQSNGLDDDGDGFVDDFRGWDFVSSDNDPTDGEGHGTHVAGTIAARGDNNLGIIGVAPQAGVLPLRVLDDNGSGTMSAVADAFALAGRLGIGVVNASLGSAGDSSAMESAIRAYPNTLYVVAAGNGGADGIGDNNDQTPTYPCASPAANVICVGASDQNDNRASFSNYGASSVDLYAPGTNVLSTWLNDSAGAAQYYFADGTSMATPHVAGVLALMRAYNPAATATQLKAALLGSVDQRAGLSGLSVSGGRLSASGALAALTPSGPVSLSPPTVSGTPAAGMTLTTAGNGAWSGYPSSYSYQWQRASSGAFSDIPGATGASYTVSASDTGFILRVKVTAANAAGSASNASASTDLVVPVNVAAPTLTGTPTVGEVITQRSLGAWTGTPTLSAEWQRCDRAQSACVTKSTASTYPIGETDTGNLVRLKVTASQNGVSSAPVYVALASVVAPYNTSAPSLTGTAVVGEVLTRDRDGVWTGAPTFSYQWQRQTAGPWVDIPGATGASYALTDADIGSPVRLQVTAAMNGASASSASSPTQPVTGVPRTPTLLGTPTISGPPSVGQTLTGTEGFWSDAKTFAYQWQRQSAEGWADIPGALTVRYTPTSADAGLALRLKVTAANGSSTSTSVSAPTAALPRPSSPPVPLSLPAAVLPSGRPPAALEAVPRLRSLKLARPTVTAKRPAALSFVLNRPASVKLTFFRVIPGHKQRAVHTVTLNGRQGLNRTTIKPSAAMGQLPRGAYRLTVQATAGALRDSPAHLRLRVS